MVWTLNDSIIIIENFVYDGKGFGVFIHVGEFFYKDLFIPLDSWLQGSSINYVPPILWFFFTPRSRFLGSDNVIKSKSFPWITWRNIWTSVYECIVSFRVRRKPNDMWTHCRVLHFFVSIYSKLRHWLNCVFFSNGGHQTSRVCVESQNYRLPWSRWHHQAHWEGVHKGGQCE